MKEKFCIYCSDGASRIIKFYSIPNNIKLYKPTKVIYDGNKKDTISLLIQLFKEDLIIFNEENEEFDIKHPHSSTSKFIHRSMNKFDIKYLLCFGNKILKKEFINAYPNRLINFHPSILPSFKGLMAIDQAIKAKSFFIGNTAHYIDEGIDTGKIILQTSMLLQEFEEYEDVLEMQFPMIKMILRDILKYNIDNKEIISEIKNRTKKILIPNKCNL